MGKKKKKTIFCLSTTAKEDINKRFFLGYDYKHWFFRLKVNELILAKLEDFYNEYGDSELQKESMKEFQLSLKTEFISMFYHTTEALFLLLGGLTTEVPIWIALSQIKTSKIFDFIRKIILPQKLTTNDIWNIFYFKLEIEDQELFDNSIKFIIGYLKKIGEMYLNNKIYNDYEHGLRIMRTSGFWITMQREGDPKAKSHTMGGGPALIHLNHKLLEKEDTTEYKRVEEIAEVFDPELFYRLTKKNYELIKNIIHVRREMIIQAKNNSKSKIMVTLFEESLEDLFKVNRRGGLTKFTFKYPTIDPPNHTIKE